VRDLERATGQPCSERHGVPGWDRRNALDDQWCGGAGRRYGEIGIKADVANAFLRALASVRDRELNLRPGRHANKSGTVPVTLGAPH
jgi:hypothetical protein